MIARLYVKTPYYFRCVDIQNIPSIWSDFNIPFLEGFHVKTATYKLKGYDVVNDEYIYVNEVFGPQS